MGTDIREKAGAVLFAFLMVTSVFGATVAFSGTAAAAQTGLSDVRVTEGLTVRADDPGESIDIEVDINTDGNAGSQTTYNIDTASLEAAGVDFSSITDSDVEGSSTSGDVDSLTYDSANSQVVLDYTDDGSPGTETVSITIGDATPGTTAFTGNQLGTSGVSPGASATISVVDQAGSFTSVSTTTTINAADINIGSVTNTGGGSTALGNDVVLSVNSLTYDSDGVSVTGSNVQGTITNEQPEFGNRSVSLSGSTTATVENLIQGDHNLFVRAGDLSDGTAARNADSQSNTGGAYTVSGLRLELDTDEGEVAGEDIVLFNSQQEVRGTVFRTSANAPTQVIADDRVVDYEVLDPNGNTVTNGDTNTGQFSVSETYSATTTLNDNDNVDRGTYTRRDGLTYNVNIGDGGGPTSGNQGSDTFTTLLDINFQIDGTSAPNADVTFDDTVQISGTVQDGAGNSISDYRVTTKLYADSGASTPQKVGTTTTGANGEFSFTLRLNDGVQDPNIGAITGADGANLGVQLGTHQVDRADAIAGDVGNGNGTASPHPAVHYETVATQASGQVQITADQNAPVNFEDQYRVRVLDQDGDPVQNARVLIQGAFDGNAGSSGTPTVGSASSDDVTLDTGSLTTSVVSSSTQIATEQVDGSGQNEIVAFQASTDSDGYVNFTAISVQSTFTANATAEETAIDTDVPTEITVQAATQDGRFDIFSQPDVAQREPTTFTVGGADPVNIVDEDVEDPQTGNPETGGSPNVNDGDNNANFQSIFTDSGPSTVEVLPLTDSAANRITDGTRLGFDTNRDLEGITVYRVQFELRDESNAVIDPNPGTSGAFDEMRVTGASVNGTIAATGTNTIAASGDGILDAQYTDIDSDTVNEYTFLLQPTEVESDSGSIDHEIDVEGESNVTLSLDADGLNIAQFQVDGSPAQSVQPQSTVNLTAVVQDAEEGDVPINNGRVRLAQNGTELANFDARTQNTNNGEYTFQSVRVGARGFDSASDNDGVGEGLSNLDFTAYQYADANDDQQLVQREVDQAAVESLDIALDDGLQVEYDAEATSEYSGFQDGDFTLTRGVEYDRVVFDLTDENGNPVNLTAGLNGNEVSDLNDIAHQAGANSNPELITITSGGTELSVRFDTSASDPANGTYVISDIEEGANVDTSNGGAFNDADSFVIGSASVDSDEQAFTLNVETPDRSQATNASETGTFVAADANVETEVAGAAGNAVPNSVNDTDGNGNLIDELNNNQGDSSRLNTNVSEIETPTGEVDRVYRVNATVTDALGTPLNSSDFNDIDVDFDGSVDPVPSSGEINDDARFEMVDGSGVTTSLDDGVVVDSGSSTNDEVEVTNEDGEFQFDIEVESGGNDGEYTPVFEVEAQSNTAAAPSGKSAASQSPTVENPVVNALDQSGAELPQAENSANEILAQDVENRLRIEAFPSDEDGFTLRNGLAFGFTDPKAENTAGGTTTLSEDVVTGDFDEGQVVFIRVTPTGTGNGVVALTDQVNGAGAAARDTNGTPLLFNTLRSNLQVDITLSTTSVEAGQNVTATLSQASTDERLPENTRVSLVDPDGTEVNSALTNADGEAELAVPVGTTGTFTLETRPAGFEPNSVDLAVTEVDRPTATVTFDDKTVTNGTEEVTVDSANFTRADGSDGNYVVVVHTIDEFGAPVGSVSAPIGASGDLTGAEENITVDLTAADGPINSLTENVTLRAMLHTTANDSAFGTRLGNAIDGIEPGDETDDANITVEDEQEATAQTSVTFDDKTVTNGTEEVTVDSANFTRADGSDGNYVVVVHTIDEFGAPVGSVSAPIGASGDLTGAEENITVDLTAADGPINSLTENVTLRAMLHTTANDSAFGTRLGNAIDGIEPGDETDDANITVERGLATYQDENGDTSIDQLRDAITDFRNGDIGIDLLRDVIDSFRESQ